MKHNKRGPDRSRAKRHKNIVTIKSNSATERAERPLFVPIQSQFRRHAPLLPPEIIRAWTNNEYRIGDRHSTDYEYIGAALAIRGYYRYATFREENKRRNLLHAGYCFIDFEGSDLFIAGIRVYTGPHQTPPHDKQLDWVHPIYWRSRYSKFVSDGRLLKVHFGYCAFKFLAKNKSYAVSDLALDKAPHSTRDALRQFQLLETFWRPQREKLQRACRAAGDAGDIEMLDDALRIQGSDIMVRLQDKEAFLAELALLQHHALADTLVGIITADIGRTITGTDSQLLAAVFQPVDVPASA